MDRFLFYILLTACIIGILIIIFSLILRKTFGDKTVINIDSSKWGIALKSNAFALSIIVGLVLVIGPGIFLSKGYAQEIKKLRSQYEERRSQEELVEEFMKDLDERFKRIDMTFKLIFPTMAPPNPRAENTDIAVWIRRKGENEKHIYEKVFYDKDGHSVLLTVQDLCLDDCIHVNIKGDVPSIDKNGNAEFIHAEFSSDDIRIPVVHLNMVKE